GDAVTAVMLGALTIHGIQPGPLFITQEPKLAYGIFGAYIVGHFLMLAILFVGVRWFLRIVMVPKSVLFPVILVLCTVGAYALNNTMANVYVLALFGLIGYGMVKGGLPLAPLILGVILGDQIEINLIRRSRGACSRRRWPRWRSPSGSTTARKENCPRKAGRTTSRAWRAASGRRCPARPRLRPAWRAR
ncbi:MAG: C4-dicarboxylate transporter permease, partial [Burkholderiales bacterium]|nr:C4-dicarboxylate transporter permease [Burkholderiales bacterium]